MFKPTLACAGLLALLSGCTVSDVATLRTLSVDAGAAYIQENHEWRRDLRREYRSIVMGAIAECRQQAAAENVTGSTEDAVSVLDQCLAFIQKHYPKLATVELLKEGKAGINSLKGVE